MNMKTKRKGTPRRWKTVIVLCMLILASGITAYWLLRKPIDDEAIIYLQDGNLWRMTFDGQRATEQLTNFTEWGNTVWRFDVSYDGRYAVMEATAGKWIQLLDLQTGDIQLVRDCEAEGEDCVEVDFNPERNVVVYTYGTHTAGSVWTYDVESDIHTRLGGVQGLYAHWLDGQHLMYQSWYYDNVIYHVETNSTINHDDLGVEYIPSYLPQHHRVLIMIPSEYQSQDMIPTVTLDGVHSELDLHVPPRQTVINFGFTEMWNPDGSKIAYGTENPNGVYSIIVLDVATGETSTVARPTGTPTWMRWNADGTRLLVTLVHVDNTNDNHVVAYDLNTGETAVIENATYAAWQL